MKASVGVLFVLLLAIAPDSYAVRHQDWGGAEDDWSMPTATAWSGPTTTACRALGRDQQGCKDCVQQYYDNGEPSKVICGFVAQSAYCNCEAGTTLEGQKFCNANGVCTYSW